MAVISIDLGAKTADVVNTLCVYGGYQVTLIDGTPNPVTKAQFAKKIVTDFIKNIYREQKVRDARQAFEETVITTSNTAVNDVADIV